jgi:hypothetical protein
MKFFWHPAAAGLPAERRTFFYRKVVALATACIWY